MVSARGFRRFVESLFRYLNLACWISACWSSQTKFFLTGCTFISLGRVGMCSFMTTLHTCSTSGIQVHCVSLACYSSEKHTFVLYELLRQLKQSTKTFKTCVRASSLTSSCVAQGSRTRSVPVFTRKPKSCCQHALDIISDTTHTLQYTGRAARKRIASGMD